MIPWLIGAGIVAFVLFGGDSVVVDELIASIKGRGDRVGRATTTDALGVIRLDPGGLADAAGLDLDTYALARMLSSEEGNSPLPYKLAVGFAAVNFAKGNIAAILLKARGSADGYFGRQNARYDTGVTELDGTHVTAHAGKYASTGIDPHEDDVTLATAILGGQLPDPTGGATNFYSPRVQDVGYDAGKPGYDKTAAEVDRDWQQRGLEPVTVEGVNPRELQFYRPKGVA